MTPKQVLREKLRVTVLLVFFIIVLFFVFGLAFYMQLGLCPPHLISAFSFSTVWIFPTLGVIESFETLNQEYHSQTKTKPKYL